MRHELKYRVLSGRFAVCRLAQDSHIPDWASDTQWFFIARTADELSIVCGEENVPNEVQSEKGWACIQLQGPFPLEMTGVLAAVLNPLAAAGIGIFAVSTFDTDYVLVKADQLRAAEMALTSAGHVEAG